MGIWVVILLLSVLSLGLVFLSLVYVWDNITGFSELMDTVSLVPDCVFIVKIMELEHLKNVHLGFLKFSIHFYYKNHF